jgi:two-component system chemotaxis response regulator CheB
MHIRFMIPHHRDIVAIGASVGGIEATCALLRALPSGLPVIILVALHRSPYRKSHLQEVLSRSAPMPVLIAEEGDHFRHGYCYIGRPGYDLIVGPGVRAHLLEDGFYQSHSVDALFSSQALHAGPRTIGVILSGLRKDGSYGLAQIKQAGGLALVQNPKEATYSEMPGAQSHMTDLSIWPLLRIS